MIPKTIHYCWFGAAPLPEKERKCIESWRKYCPDYQIIEWNESNYDITKNEYIKQAYDAKRWAFVTDFVRLDIIYQYGGIYLDTDVELIKSLDSIIENNAFAGMECVDGLYLSVNTGLGFGAEKNHPIIAEWRNYYNNITFIQPDGKYDLLTTPARTTAQLEKHGFKQENVIQRIPNMTIYPTEYFSPKQYGSDKIVITSNTISIHHYSETWKTEEEKTAAQKWEKLSKRFGPHMADIISGLINIYKKRGIIGTFVSLMEKLFSKKKD